MTDRALSHKIQTHSLESHIQRFESSDEHLSWVKLMEWFVEAVMGAELIRNEHPSAPPLTSENIRIDSSSTIVIDQPSIIGSLSSDISTLNSFFLHIHRTLEQRNRLIIPLHIKHEDIVFSRFMNVGPSSSPFLLHNLASSFTQFVLHPDHRNNFIPADHSFLRGDDVEDSEQLLDAVKKVKKSHSMETVRNACFDHFEWVKMMEFIEKDAKFGSDLSFLQSHCFRATLLSLQSKHQLRANPPQPEESNETESSQNEMNTSITRLPIDTHHGIRQTSLSANPLYDSSSPNNRPLHFSDSVVDASFQPTPHFVDENEKFDVSLFDEADDQRVVAALRRCHTVLEATKSTECIVNLDTFRTFLVAGLHSSNFAIQMECYRLFFRSAELHWTADDPFNSKFQNLHKAFRDGTIWEKIALLHLWMRWFDFGDRDEHGQMMVESDFDFDGFLAADLAITPLFDEACCFVERIVVLKKVSMTPKWKLDFLLSFEKRHQMMSRLTNEPSPSSKLERPKFFLSQFAITLGSFLSVFRGCDFPSALTEVIASDLDSSRQEFMNRVSPTFFLNHTSINPKHRHSFFPMDLMFERYLRTGPGAFFEGWADLSDCPSRKFLFTPCVGLHSLLHRCPKLDLDQPSLARLLLLLILEYSDQETTPTDLVKLFCYFPPPRLFDAFLSPPRLDGPFFPIENLILVTFCDFGEYVTPFGACSSLAKVFKILAPYDSNPERKELNRLNIVGDQVVSLHWLNIPAHFDSPLLCHLPSLAGAQRGVLQTLSSHSGIPSLVTPNTPQSNWNHFRTAVSQTLFRSDVLLLLCLSVHHLTYFDVRSPPIALLLLNFPTRPILSPIPALASAAFEFFHRFVSVSSDAVRMELVKRVELIQKSPFCPKWHIPTQTIDQRRSNEEKTVGISIVFVKSEEALDLIEKAFVVKFSQNQFSSLMNSWIFLPPIFTSIHQTPKKNADHVEAGEEGKTVAEGQRKRRRQHELGHLFQDGR
ncbi:hypothetical protein BLNAU_8721 [Blattamonas nauphoetae]|uniref:Uncharacterized protein n=1 Tax=Blattamonas nauphoetae TaxID=2049346 RepID=A0ABQ9XXZ8_9EUKA|nr:hypothetical protein BLNAU_8721 [Blattamonas nauphoetae]